MRKLTGMRVHFANIAGASTRYYEAGAGFPVMLIHGVGVTAEIWLRNIEVLGSKFHICAPDTLGSGLTDAGSYRTGPIHPHVVAHLLALADHLGFDKFAVVGSSLGSLFAALLYFAAPTRVSKLVLTAAGSVFNGDEAYLKTWRAVANNGSLAYSDPTLENCRKRMTNVVADPACLTDEMLVMQMTCYALPQALDLFRRRTEGMLDLEAIKPYRVRERLEEIAVSTLAIIGADDPRVDTAQARRDMPRVANGRLEIFPACSHYPQLEHPDRFNATVADFLAT
jgi:2-hydroxy-6-oxonona-2,4-dienedioate hydrolase